MDIARMLETDHRRTEQLLEDIARAEGDQRMPLIEQLDAALTAHLRLEESIVYPAMEPVTGTEAVREILTENELARTALAEVVALAPDRPGFERALEALEAAIEDHVEDEERGVLPELRSEGGLLRELAIPFTTLRCELGLPTEADAHMAS